MTIDPIAHLERRLPTARVFSPGSAGFDQALRLWNAEIRTRPVAVVTPESADEVAAAVIAARESGVPVSVRGGGHDWLGRSLRDEGVVIDLSRLRGVQIVGGEARVEGGARAVDVVAAASREGQLVATGTAGVVGMAGLTLGGGYGPLLGRMGLAADRLVAAVVVTADGLIVSTDDDRELLWGLRGGGGNFGVVTSMTIKLEPGNSLTGGIVLFPGDQARDLLAAAAEILAEAPDELTVLFELATMPEVGPVVMAVPVWSGDPGESEHALARVRGIGESIMDTVACMTQPDLLALFDEQVPDGMHWDIRTRTIAHLTPEIIEVLLRAADARPGPAATIGLRHFHGAATRHPLAGSAFGRRDEHMVIEISAGWTDADEAAPFREWLHDTWSALGPHALPGGYPNFLAPARTEQVEHAYGPNRDRLIDLKERLDPDGVFSATPLPVARE